MIIKDDKLKKIREGSPDSIIVFCSGSFDLTHAGHALFLEDAKAHGDVLVVGVGSDDAIRGHKPTNRPILNESIRLKMVDSLKPVDYTFLTHRQPEDKSWLYPIELVFAMLHPDIYVVNTDARDMEARKELAAKYGVQIKIHDRWHPPEFGDISTTNIINRIAEGNDR